MARKRKGEYVELREDAPTNFKKRETSRPGGIPTQTVPDEEHAPRPEDVEDRIKRQAGVYEKDREVAEATKSSSTSKTLSEPTVKDKNDHANWSPNLVSEQTFKSAKDAKMYAKIMRSKGFYVKRIKTKSGEWKVYVYDYGKGKGPSKSRGTFFAVPKSSRVGSGLTKNPYSKLSGLGSMNNTMSMGGGLEALNNMQGLGGLERLEQRIDFDLGGMDKLNFDMDFGGLDDLFGGGKRGPKKR